MKKEVISYLGWIRLQSDMVVIALDQNNNIIQTIKDQK